MIGWDLMKFKLKQVNLIEAVSNQQHADQMMQNSIQSLNDLRSDISDYWQFMDFTDLKKAVESVNQVNDASLRIIGLIANLEEMLKDYNKFISSGDREYFDDMIVDEIYFLPSSNACLTLLILSFFRKNLIIQETKSLVMKV